MPRVNGVYQLLPGVYGVPNEPIASAPYNSQLDDLAKDANDPRPVTAGGTGAQTPGDALTNFGFSAFVKSLLGKASDVLFRTAIGADDATNLTKGTLDKARLPVGVLSEAANVVDNQDFDLLTTPGMEKDLYRGDGPHGPGSGTYFFVDNKVYNGSQITQIAWPYAAPLTEIYIRGRYNNAWSKWKKVIYQSEDVKAQRFLAGGAATDPTNIATTAQFVTYSARRAFEWGYPSGGTKSYVNTIGADVGGWGHLLFGGEAADTPGKWNAYGTSKGIGIRNVAGGSAIEWFTVPNGLTKDSLAIGRINEAGNQVLRGFYFENEQSGRYRQLWNIPAGMIAFFALTSAPSGWLPANGAGVLKANYPDLWAAVTANGMEVSEATWQSGYYGRYSNYSADTFRVPLINGSFLRAWDNGAGIDPSGSSLGYKYSDSIRSHNHSVTIDSAGSHNHRQPVYRGWQDAGTYAAANIATVLNAWAPTDYDGAHYHTGTVGYAGGAQTQPISIPLLACIKY